MLASPNRPRSYVAFQEPTITRWDKSGSPLGKETERKGYRAESLQYSAGDRGRTMASTVCELVLCLRRKPAVSELFASVLQSGLGLSYHLQSPVDVYR
jgi:hypothetical protein